MAKRVNMMDDLDTGKSKAAKVLSKKSKASNEEEFGGSTIMRFKKETKQTFVYESSKDDAIVQTVYVMKRDFDGKAPKKIKLTIAEID